MTTPTGILFSDPQVKPLSTTGAPQAGCYYCFFLTGTTTPANVYADGLLSTPLSQPTPGSINPSGGTVAASDGRFVPIYLNPATTYRAQLYSAAGVKLEDTDPYLVANVSITAAQLAAPGSGQGADLVANAVKSYDIFSDLRAEPAPTLAAGQTLVVIVEGSAVITDGLGGIFYWNASSSAADDNVNVIKPTGLSGSGRYLRQQSSSLFGSGTLTGTGFSGTAPSFTYVYRLQGQVTYMIIEGTTGTSNANTFTMTGLPSGASGLSPLTVAVTLPCLVEDNGTANLAGWASINTSGVLTFGLGSTPNFSGFTTSGSKGVPGGGITLVFPQI